MKRSLSLSAIFALSTLALSGSAQAADTCAYVMGTVNGGTVATPAIIVVTPDVSAVVTPAQVMVDETTQEILGYRLSTPPLGGTTPGQSVFVPGHREEISSYSATLDGLNIGRYRCINLGTSTPAVPIFVPPSFLQTPGVSATTPGATLTIAQEQVTVPAHTVSIPGHTVLVPGISETIQPIPVETPEQSLTINFEVPWVVPYLAPVVIDGNQIIGGLL